MASQETCTCQRNCGDWALLLWRDACYSHNLSQRQGWCKTRAGAKMHVNMVLLWGHESWFIGHGEGTHQYDTELLSQQHLQNSQNSQRKDDGCEVARGLEHSCLSGSCARCHELQPNQYRKSHPQARFCRESSSWRRYGCPRQFPNTWCKSFTIQGVAVD